MTPETTKAKKERVCFVVMPISDIEGYESGHFNRVYEHLLKPSCSKAGFTPIRADEVAKTNYIIIDILRKIIESDLVLCDISARNPNVLYELGIRQAFNKPVTLVKDSKTEKIFDIQGFRYAEYDHTLRVDSVQRDLDKIAKSLTDTASSSQADINSLLQLLAIEPASLPQTHQLSSDTSLILGAIKDLSMKLLTVESNLAPLLTSSPKKETLKIQLKPNIPVLFDSGEPGTIGDNVHIEEKPGFPIDQGQIVDIHHDAVYLKKGGKVSQITI